MSGSKDSRVLHELARCVRPPPHLTSSANHLNSAYQDDNPIKIALDDSINSYFVQKAVLCSASDYFVKALQENTFSEGQTRTLRLPGCDEGTLVLFLYWLTYRELPAGHLQKHGEDASCRCHGAMIKLWAFADACLLPQLQNSAIYALWELCSTETMATADASLAYKLTGEDSLLSQMMAEFMHYYISTRIWNDSETFTMVGGIPGFFESFIDELRVSGCEKQLDDFSPPERSYFYVQEHKVE